MKSTLLPSALKDTTQKRFVTGREDYETVARGQPLFHWFIVGAVAFLLMETGFQMLVKRKAAPAGRPT